MYGKVELQEDLEIGEGESLTIPEGSSLDMGGNEITVASGGKLEGTPTGIGTVKIAPTITTESLPEGTVGTAYNQLLGATGDATITWSLASGSTLPAGLSLGTDGTISGKPTTAGHLHLYCDRHQCQRQRQQGIYTDDQRARTNLHYLRRC